ncbi:MAG TPA: hypothetical protein VI136_05025 [Verrucomicrobiae bacterium]
MLEQQKPIDQIVKKLAKTRRRPEATALSKQQTAVGELMCAAVREYSESRYAASWCSGIEHLLWDEVVLRKEDAYERVCARLHKLAGSGCWRRPRQRSLFAEGLKLLSERYGIWFYYERGKGEKAIRLKEWLPLHEAWMQRGIEQRMPYDKVWELANWELGDPRDKPVPPMPRIKLPPIKPK